MESIKTESHPPINCKSSFDQSESISASLDTLPDVTLVRILSFLPLKDRFTAARVCRTLYEAFLHPSHWYQMKVVLFAKIDTSMDRSTCDYYVKTGVMPKNYLNIIVRFGKYFQNLTIILHDYDGMVLKECQTILKLLAAICHQEDSDTPQYRLQSLHIRVNYIIPTLNSNHHYHPAEITLNSNHHYHPADITLNSNHHYHPAEITLNSNYHYHPAEITLNSNHHYHPAEITLNSNHHYHPADITLNSNHHYHPAEITLNSNHHYHPADITLNSNHHYHPADMTAHRRAHLSNAYCLHSFSLHSWPHYNDVETPDILQTLVQKEKLHQLEELKLFWFRYVLIV